MTQFLLQQSVNALALAAIYSLLAIGVTVVFGLTGIVNFAHGEVMMIGAYVTLFCSVLPGGYWIGAAAAILTTLALGLLLERSVFRFTLSRPITGFIASLGVIIVLQNAASAVAGPAPRSIPPPIPGVWTTFGTRTPVMEVFLCAVCVVCIVAYFAVVERTRYGRALRACSEDLQVAELMGIPSRRLIMLAFIVGSGLAGVAGALLVGIIPITPAVGSSFIVYAFAVALVGGLGNAWGVLLGAGLLGVADTLIPGLLIPQEWEPVVVFGIVFAVILIRPRGLLRGLEGSAVT